MTPPPAGWPAFLRELNDIEHACKYVPVDYPRGDAVPWMPFPISAYATLLTEAITAAPPGPLAYLDVGCGPGTKIRLAEALYGVTGYGIDIALPLIAQALADRVNATVTDAYELPAHAPPGQLSYGAMQIISVNRPSTDRALEHLIMDRAAPGAVLIAINWCTSPAAHGWQPAYTEEGSAVIGVWVKPQPANAAAARRSARQP